MTTCNMTLEEARQGYSDFYKEAHGFRPRTDTSRWTLDDFAQAFDRLSLVCEMNRRDEEASQAFAIETFEKNVQKTIATGAKDRATAIRWLMDGEQEGAYEFECGLPYGYLREHP